MPHSEVDKIVEELRSLGNEATKKVLLKHGAKEPFFGVKITDLKPIVKRIKKDYSLSLDLYSTGISDAMYLAGLIADDAKMTYDDLQKWVQEAYWPLLSETTVPTVTAGSTHGFVLAREWIESAQESVESSGWATYSNLVALHSDESIDMAEMERLLSKIKSEIHTAPNRVRSTMNAFLISVSGYVIPMTELGLETARNIGKVTVDMGETSCKVPDAVVYIEKMKEHGSYGKKRKTVKC